MQDIDFINGWTGERLWKVFWCYALGSVSFSFSFLPLPFHSCFPFSLSFFTFCLLYFLSLLSFCSHFPRVCYGMGMTIRCSRPSVPLQRSGYLYDPRTPMAVASGATVLRQVLTLGPRSRKSGQAAEGTSINCNNCCRFYPSPPSDSHIHRRKSERHKSLELLIVVSSCLSLCFNLLSLPRSDTH